MSAHRNSRGASTECNRLLGKHFKVIYMRNVSVYMLMILYYKNSYSYMHDNNADPVILFKFRKRLLKVWPEN